jgi:hypothetical protein
MSSTGADLRGLALSGVLDVGRRLLDSFQEAHQPPAVHWGHLSEQAILYLQGPLAPLPERSAASRRECQEQDPTVLWMPRPPHQAALLERLNEDVQGLCGHAELTCQVGRRELFVPLQRGEDRVLRRCQASPGQLGVEPGSHCVLGLPQLDEQVRLGGNSGAHGGIDFSVLK